MFEIALMMIAGIVAGTIAGLLPAVNILMTLLVLYPVLLHFPAENILFFYVSLMLTTQYMGSISAITLGIPGEASSVPAVQDGHPLFRIGFGSHLIKMTSIGSFVGSVFVLLGALLILPQIDLSKLALGNNVKIVLFLLTTVFLAFVGGNKLILNIIFMTLGLTMSAIGVNDTTLATFMTFGFTELYNGLPIITVLGCIFVLPEMIKLYYSTTLPSAGNDIFVTTQKLPSAVSPMIRGSILGFFCGLIPGVTTNLASILGQVTEKYLSKTTLPGHFKAVVSSETANNAAATSSLIPLLLIGLPIVASESLIYQILTSKGFVFGPANIIWTVLILAFITNIICVILSWPLVSYLKSIHRIPTKVIIFITSSIIIGSIIQEIISTDTFWLNIGVIAFLAPLGFLIRKNDTSPIIFAFLMGDQILGSFQRWIQLNGW